MARTSRTNEEPFLAWLRNKLTQKEISDCYLYCLEIEPLLKRKHWIRSSFFEVDSPDIIMQTIRLIDEQKIYSSTKKEIFRHIKDSLFLYMNFLKEKPLPEANKTISNNSPVNAVISPVDKDDAHPNKDWIEQEKNAFMIWQRENGQMEVNVTLYAQAVERASDLAKKLNCKYVDFYCPDPKTTEAALCELRANAKFTAINMQKNFIFTRAIKKYAEFQQNRQNKKESSDKGSKISWTKYEAAILLDGCIEIINNSSRRTEVIQRISHDLRQMAINSGLEIDDIYRNTNGIQFQMMSMESAFWGKTIVKPSTALFREIVLLYQMNQGAYNSLLAEARGMVSKDANPIYTGSQFHPSINSAALPLTGKNSKTETLPSVNPNETNNYDSAEGRESQGVQTLLTAYEQWLIAKKALSPKSAVVYRQTLKSLPTVVDCNDTGLTLLSASAPVIEKALNKCLESAEFGRGRVSQFRCAVMAYLEFLGQYNPSSGDSVEIIFSDAPAKDSAVHSEELRQISRILATKFTNGIRKESFIDLRKFKKIWEDTVGSEYTEADEDLKKAIASVCIDTGERWYLPSSLLSDVDKELLDRELSHFFNGDHHILYISQLYEAVQKQLSNKLVTPELFGVVLRSYYRRKYYFSREAIADAANVRLDISKEIEKEIVSHGRPLAVNILLERLGYIPADRVEQELKRNHHFIRNIRDKETGGEFFHDSMLRFTENEALEIVDIINGCIIRDDYALRGDVLKRLFVRLPEVAERTEGYSDSGVWEIIRRRLVNRFSFTDTIACKLGVWLTNTDLLTMFCKNRTPFTWDEYKDFAREIGTQQNAKLAQQHAFRVSQNQYISKSDIAFQVDQTDAAISLYFTGDSIPAESILSFDAFPSCGYPWNHYLLEQYVLDRSQKYCLDGGGNYGLSGTIRLR